MNDAISNAAARQFRTASMLSNNEHVLTAREVAAAGGHGEVYRLRKALLAGTARYDIVGAMGAVIADVRREPDHPIRRKWDGPR